MSWFETEDFWRDFYPYMFSSERFAAAPEEVNRIIALTQCAGGSLLDLCCGPGRHTLEFAQRGFQVTGVDRSKFLLDRAREHASALGASIEWVQEDMRNFIRPGAFDLVCNLFTSFGYFEQEDEDLQVLRNIHESLKQNGVLIIDVLGKERLAHLFKDTICTDLEDGSLLVQRHQLLSGWSRLRNQWILVKGEYARRFSFEFTIYSGRELKDSLLKAGFEQVQLFGDFQGAPYNLEAARLVAVARKSNSGSHSIFVEKRE